MKSIKRISEKYYLRQIVVCWLVFYMLFGIPAQIAMADPNPADTAHPSTGTGGYTATLGGTAGTVGNTTTVTAPNGSIFDWQNFDIGKDHIVNIAHSADDAVLHRINVTDGFGDGAATGINGRLDAAGSVFVVNPLGLVFGPAAYVTARNLVGSSLLISADDFTNGTLQFAGGGIGDVETLAGSRIEAEGISLIGRNVYNRGQLIAPGGGIILAAGEDVLITGVDSDVVVVVAPLATPSDHKVDHGGSDGTGPGSMDVAGGRVILAAGDIFSAAIEGVEALRAEAQGDFTNEGGITAYDDASSDALAQIEIIAGGDVYVNDDIEAEAEGDGVFNATAQVRIEAVGDVEITGTAFDDTEVKATATDGLNNTAKVDISAQGDFTQNDGVVIKAKADSDEFEGLLNQADVSITARNVTIETLSEGWIDWWFSVDALVKAYARDGSQNRAKVEITATGEESGDVLLQAGGAKDCALVKASAKDGSENYADVVINATGDVDVIAEKADAQVIAQAEGEEEYTVLNEAGVDITAGGDVHIKSEGGKSFFCDFTPYVASVDAIAEYALTSNTANIDIAAGGDVVVLSKDGGQARVEAYAAYGGDGSTNTANINMTAEDGYVMVHGIDGSYNWWTHNFTPSKASVEATAEYVGDEKEATGSSNNANITIVANDVVDGEDGEKDGDVLAIAVNGGKVEIEAKAMYGDDNLAGVDITADGDVKVTAECFDQPSQAEIMALAKSSHVSNTADIGIAAGGDVKVKAEDGGKAEVEAIAKDTDGSNTANVGITTADGDVLVLGKYGDASIEAIAKEGFDNTATIAIDAVGGDVKVIDIGESDDTAKIEAVAEDADNSNTADITISATAVAKTELVEVSGGVFEEVIEVEGGDVKVIAKDGGKADIKAFAANSGGPATNAANVTINATGEYVEQEIIGEGGVVIGTEIGFYGGDVKVIAEGCGSEAEIEALAMQGQTNIADVLICIDGDVKVKGDYGGESEIEALAKYGYSNTATVGIGAKGEKGVEVIADRGGEAGISSKAKDGSTNTASTIVCTGGGVDVIATRGGDAEILAQAKHGLNNDAYVGIGAMGDVLVQTGTLDMAGCDALIRAEAEMGDIQIQQLPDEEPVITTADAEVVVFSHEGSVEVLANNHGHSGIEAEAQGAHLNTANVGVAAGADLSPSDVTVPDYTNGNNKTFLSTNNFDMLPLSGNVLVEAFGEGSEAQILAWAHDAASIYEYPDTKGDSTVTFDLSEPTITPGENTAKTVICAPGEVRVTTYEGGKARIKSRAGWYGEQEAINKATTRVYATDVKVNTSAFRGQGIWAWAYSDNSDNPHVPGEMLLDYLGDPYTGDYYCMTEHGEVAWTDGDAVLYIQDYSKRTDCPTCPPCPCEEEPIPPVPPAPLAELIIPGTEEVTFALGGCPALMAWLADELGIEEDIQVYIANTFSLSTDIQPCELCARLKGAAMTLADGARIGALGLVVNEFVTAPIPPSEEQMALIAAAMSGAEPGTHYAEAGEWIDALAGYVSLLIEMGYSAGDAVALVSKYVEPVSETGDAVLTSYVEAQLAGFGG